MLEARLKILLRKCYQRQETTEERDELMRLLMMDDLDDPAKQYLLELTREGEVVEELGAERAADILSKILESDDVPHVDVEVNRRSPAKILKTLFSNYWAAALVGLLFFAGAFVFMFRNESPLISAGGVSLGEEVSRDLLLPGKDRASLTLWNGTVINLESENPDFALNIPNIEVDVTKGELIYKGMERETGLNEVRTPLGGQYRVVLPDGSRAWLNAGSSLKFPTSFEPDVRNVQVSGEVFFEVKRDVSRPFIVQLPQSNVQKDPVEIVVLGTSFNVSSYHDDPVIETTLLEGSVRVLKGRDSKVLLPGEQAEVKKIPRSDEGIIVKEVDSEGIAAWKEGRFEFGGRTLEEIMAQVARWYVVSVEFENEKLRSKSFVGAISRKESAAEVLKILELTGGVRFEVSDQTIKVKSI